MPCTVWTWFLKWLILLRTTLLALHIGWRQDTGWPASSLLRWSSMWSHMYKVQQKECIRSWNSNRSFLIQYIHCVFLQIRGKQSASVKGWKSKDSSFTCSSRVIDCSLQGQTFCWALSAIIRLMAQIQRFTMSSTLRPMWKSHTTSCSCVCSSSWCRMIGATYFSALVLFNCLSISLLWL